MRIIKLAIISFVLFFLLFTAISFLFPSHIRLSKAINIGAPQSRILSLIKDTSKWATWHPAFDKSAAGNNQSIVLKPLQVSDSLIVMDISNSGKKSMQNGWQLYHHTGTDSITVQWFMDFNLKWYPWQKFGSLLYEPAYGGMMEEGLQNLKEEAEY